MEELLICPRRLREAGASPGSLVVVPDIRAQIDEIVLIVKKRVLSQQTTGN